MNNDLLYQIALTLVPQVGPVQSRILVDKLGSATTIFKTSASLLEKIEGIGSVRAKNIKTFRNFAEAEKEIRFIEKYKINPLFITDPKYPQRLLNCYDPPTLLFYRGKADLNCGKVIAVIGTRNNSEYGKQIAESLIKDLSTQQMLIASGLAFGIDAIAHKSCIKHGAPTLAVLAHGLDTIYPLQHNALAKEIIREGGGLITEFRSFTQPDKHHFPTRNRIVAGMSDAIIVIESGLKGGSMVTAELANGYNRDVFALPGKTTDLKSAGCNFLIRNNKAVLFTGATDLLQLMGWEEQEKPARKLQKEFFVQLSVNEKIIMQLLQANKATTIDELNFYSGLSSSSVAAAILNLELQNLIQSLPGKRYRIID